MFPVLKSYINLTTWTGSSCRPCCSRGAESQVCSCAWCKGDSFGAQTDKGNGHQGLNLALVHEERSYHNGVTVLAIYDNMADHFTQNGFPQIESNNI